MSILCPETDSGAVSDSRTFKTNLDREYTMPKYNFTPPEPFQDPRSVPTFAGPHMELYNQHYVKLKEFDSFPKMPNPDDFDNLAEYQLSIGEWEQAVAQFSSKIALPQTISHSLPRPTRPEIIPQADREDPVTRAKLKRTFNPFTSPAQPANQMAVETILHNGTPYNPDDNLPYAGLNEKPVPIHAYIESKNAWATELIPQRPDPFLYEYFDDYEDASLRWASLVQTLEIIPPAPSELGELSDLPVEGNPSIVPPYKPRDPVKPPKPITNFECGGKSSEKALKKLLKKYKRTQKQLTALVPSTDKVKGIVHQSKTFTPPHAGTTTATTILNSYLQYGVPYTTLKGLSHTQIRRRELMTLDVGFLAQPDLYDSSAVDVKKETTNLLGLLQSDVKSFLTADLSPRQYLNFLYEKLPSGDLVGGLLSKRLTVAGLVEFSALSNSMRFLIRCSITAQFFLGLSSTSEQVLDLLLPHLERFIELLTFCTPFSFALADLPEDELAAAIDVEREAKVDHQLEQMANDFRQAQLLKTLQCAVFTSPDRFFPFFNIIRPLIHKCFCRLSDIVMSDVTFPVIQSGFMSPKPLVHMFYFRLLRTIVETEYSRLIRVFATHDLLKFFQQAINPDKSNIPDKTSLSDKQIVYTDEIKAMIKRDACSLWQLIMHSDSSLALRIQILNQKPSTVLRMFEGPPSIMHRYILDVFTLFRCNNAEFDYRPFPLHLYKAYIDHLCPEPVIRVKEPTPEGGQGGAAQNPPTKEVRKIEKKKAYLSELKKQYPNLENPYYVRALTLLLGMMRDYQSIYCKDRCDLKDLANTIISKRSILITEFDLVRCLKVLYKNDLLEAAKANQNPIWTYVFDTIVEKDIKMETRIALWRTFRNALLSQKGFMQFILQSPELTKKFEDAFNSLDENVSYCMILILPQLAQNLIEMEKFFESERFGKKTDEPIKKNLEEFFRKLSDNKTVRIAGRLLPAYQSTNTNTIMAQVHSALVRFLRAVIIAKDGSALAEFRQSVQGVLGGVLEDVKTKTVI